MKMYLMEKYKPIDMNIAPVIILDTDSKAVILLKSLAAPFVPRAIITAKIATGIAVPNP